MADENSSILEWSPDRRFFKLDFVISTIAHKRTSKAYDLEDGCEVAWTSVDLEALSAEQKKRTVELISTSKCLSHANTIKVKACWDSGKDTVFVSEYQCGGSLRQYLKKIRSPRRKLVKFWCKQILEGLDYLHSSGIVHGDLSLDCIFIDPSSGTLKIGFGEDMNNKFVPSEMDGFAADIYAFGLVLLEICTMKKVYSECRTEAALTQKVFNKVLPLTVKAVQDTEILDLLNHCFKEMDDTQTLKRHSFFQEIRPTDKQPVALDSKYIKKNTIMVSVKIQKDKDFLQVSFNYNFKHDTPENATNQIIESFGLHKSNFSIISSEILKVLASAIS